MNPDSPRNLLQFPTGQTAILMEFDMGMNASSTQDSTTPSSSTAKTRKPASPIKLNAWAPSSSTQNLGSLLDKAERLKALVRFIGAELQVQETTVCQAERAAWLCKADLTTHMVIEFPSLQGITGKYYAQNSGEAEPVATAIAEHYQPLGADTPLPETDVGVLVAIADNSTLLSDISV